MALTNIQSALLYICVVMSSYFLAVMAKQTRKYSYMALITLILSIIIGFRSISVGIDTPRYAYLYTSDYISWLGDVGFTFITSVIQKKCDVNAFFFIISLLSCTLFVRGIWDLRDIADLPIMVLFFTCFSLFPLMNTIRQYLAVSLVFYSFRYLRNKEYFYFVAATVIASLIHSSAILSLGFIFFSTISEWQDFSKRKKKLIILSTLFLPIILYIVYLEFFAVKVHNKTDFYFTSFSIVAGAFGIFQLIIVWMTSNKLLKYIENGKTSNSKSIYLILKFAKTGCVLNLIGYLYPFMNRIALPYVLFILVEFAVYWKLLSDNKIINKRTLYKDDQLIFTYLQLSQTVVYLYPFISILLKDGYKVMNYGMFFW